MRHADHRTPPLALALAVALAVAGGCTDGPTDLGEAPRFDHAGNHPASTGGPPVSIEVTQQPTLEPNPSAPGNCRYPYAFVIDAKGPAREVWWLVDWVGGEHDGDNVGGSTTVIGSRIGPVEIAPLPGHPEDGHSFEALRIRVQEQFVSEDVLAEAFTEGRTMSCPV